MFEIKSAVLENDKDLIKAEKLINYSKKSSRVALIFKPKTLTKVNHSHTKNKNKILRIDFISELFKEDYKTN